MPEAWILFSGFVLIVSIAEGIYGAHETEPSQRFHLLTRMGFMALLWYWFVEEMRPHHPGLPMDFGLFLVALFFILVPYYFWRYERGRGLLKVLGFAGLYLLMWALGSLVAYVMA